MNLYSLKTYFISSELKKLFRARGIQNYRHHTIVHVINLNRIPSEHFIFEQMN